MANQSEAQGQNLNPNKKKSESNLSLSKETKFALLRKEKQSIRDKGKKKVSTIKRGKESTFWKNVRSITPNISWTRIETFGTPGIPDLLGVFVDDKLKRNISFWCELKLTKGNKLDLSPFQISWNLKRYSLCQDNFIMAKGIEERAIFFYPGALVRELVTDYREVEPLFVVHQPWTHVLEPAIRRVLVHVP
jgi:hypothetical protein